MWRVKRVRRGCTVASVAMLGLVVIACRDAALPPTAPVAAQTAGAILAASDDEVAIQGNPWRTLPSLALGRNEPGVVTYNGCVWVIGGWYGTTNASDRVEVYCPSVANAWVSGPSLPEPLSRFAGVGVIRGRIYVAGGTGLDGHVRNTIYTYDMASGWQLAAERLPFPMACGAGAVSGGKLYVQAWAPVGGVEDPADWNCSLFFEPVFAMYNPAKDAPPRWRVLPNEPLSYGRQPVRCHHSLASIGNLVYLTGGSLNGCNYGHSAEHAVGVFNTVTGQWLPAGQVPYPDEGRTMQSTVATGNRLFAIGGYNGNVFGWLPGEEVLAYEPGVNAWDELRPMPSKRYMAGAAALGTRIIVAGGNDWWSGGRVMTQALQLNVFTGCDVHEPDGSVARANPWTLRTGQGGMRGVNLARLCSASDVDYFLVVEKGEGGSSQVVLTPPPGADYQLELLNAAGSELLQRSANVGPVSETVTVPGGQGVPYILRVRSQNGSYNSVTPYKLQTQ